MIDFIAQVCDSFERVPDRIVLDIDDTEDRVHGDQELALFHAHYDGRCFLPIHVYEAITGKPVAVIREHGHSGRSAWPLPRFRASLRPCTRSSWSSSPGGTGTAR